MNFKQLKSNQRLAFAKAGGRSQAGPEAADVMASAVAVDISADHPVPLGGGEPADGPWGVDTAPEINLLALWWPEGDPLVFVTVDALYAGPDLRAAVEQGLVGIPPENIVVAASHTHSAPMLDRGKPALGVVYEKHLASVLESLQAGLQKLMDPKNRTPGTLHAGRARADHAVNRRQMKRVVWQWPPAFNRFRWRPDFWGTRDELITTLEVRDLKGNAVAAAWNYACHPVRFPDPNTVSAHYPGDVRKQIRGRLGQGVPVLFFQGFSGDLRPLALAEPRLPRSARHLWRRIARGTEWVPEGWSRPQYKQWASSLGRQVVRALAGSRPVSAAGYSARRLLAERTLFFSPAGPPLTFQAVRIGADFALVAVSGEVMADYAATVRRATGCKYVMLAGCVDDAPGYLPTRKMIGEGGYEAGGFLDNFGLSAVNPRVENHVWAHLAEALRCQSELERSGG